jgi:SET domain-containing protein
VLLVKCVVRPSPIHGLGLFADQAIRKGTKVWEFTPGFDLTLRPKDFKPWPLVARRFLKTYAYQPQKGLFILCSDHAKHFNHSAAPNTKTVGFVTTAARNIARGEELTCDYAEIEPD